MDPVSVIGLAGTALAILQPLGKTLAFLLQLSTKLKNADAKMTMLIGYLASVQVSVQHLARLVKDLERQPQHADSVESLRTTLDCTTFFLSILQSKLGGIEVDAATTLEKAILLFKSAEFDEYISSMNSYVNALNLLLNVLQAYVPNHSLTLVALTRSSGALS